MPPLAVLLARRPHAAPRPGIESAPAVFGGGLTVCVSWLSYPAVASRRESTAVMTASQSEGPDRRVFLSGAASAAGLLLGAPPAKAAPGKDFSEVDAILAAAVKASDVPWAALLVTKGGADLYAGAYGVPLGHVDVLRSATKVATVTAVLTLVATRQLGLDDPVSRYIPAFGGEKAAITVRQLLSMSSGLRSSLQALSLIPI